MNRIPGCRLTCVVALFVLSLLSVPVAAQQPPAQSQSKPALPAGVEERQIAFPTDGLTAPGTLTLPAGRHSGLPLLVMVAGSGVQDRDSTVGPNKIFQQFAWGLAQRGIATLRYDRRAIFALDNFEAHIDLDHEVVIDAASALACAATLPEIDSRKIYLLGHSLGAELVPDIVAMRLAQKPASVRGMILMSGIARPIDVVMLEQLRTLGKAQGGTPAQIDQMVAAWTTVFNAARDPKTPAGEPLGVGGGNVPAGYWRDWLSRDPVKTMQKLAVPSLVLRGANDLNASHEDFELLSKAATAPGSASLEFSGLNHEYFAGPGDGSAAFAPGQVAPAVLDAIAQWVTTGKLDSKLP